MATEGVGMQGSSACDMGNKPDPNTKSYGVVTQGQSMINRNHRTILVSLLFALLFGEQVFGQMTVTGTITGTVKDPSSQVIVGANVSLTSEGTGESRTTTTNEIGAFIFPAIPPGGYSLKMEAAGFKTLQRTGMVLSANERLALGEIQLSIGAVSETISVVAQGSNVQTASSEQSASITSQQIEALQVRGRDIPSLLKLIPGVQWMGDPDSPGGEFGSNTPNIRGMSALVNTIAVDGVVSNDIGWSRTFSSVTTMDAIGEVKVILNSYQAEYQGNGSAVMEVVSKSGGTEFHGSGYWYKRHEMLNANNFFNNRSDVSKPLYRSDALGFSLGGPIYIPGKFNRKKNWLFGFYNFEAWKIKYPGGVQRVTTPTSLERAGDFSQTLDVSGKLIAIKDPTNGQSFPGNKLPLSHINPNGLALLNILPLPNFTDRSISKGNYNYQFQESLLDPKRSQLFRIDVVPSATDRFYVRGKTWISEQEGYNVSSGASAWGLFAQCYCFTESGLGVGWTHIFTPTIVMEFTSGARHNHEGWRAYGPPDEINKILKSKVGFNLGQWYPAQNPSGFIPQVSFGGVPGSADITYNNRLLTDGYDTTFTFNDNVTVIRGPHTFKLGISANILRESEGEQSVFAGSFNFARNTNNPFDSNWAYSNALLGNFNTYSESNARYGPRERQKIVEWFVQDTWKVNRKLTVDYGIRFSWSTGMYPNIPGQQSVLGLGRYNPSQAPLLYRPAFGPNNVRMGQQPLTGELVSAVLIGAFVPGTGNPGNGGVLSGDPTYPRGFVNQQPVLVGPRLGFAYDPFGKGKTAIRAGAAILYTQRLMKANQTITNPPAIFTPILSYGQLNTYLQSAGVLAPSNTNTYNVDNQNAGRVQRDVRGPTGSSAIPSCWTSHMPRCWAATSIKTVDLNAVPYGARFLPQNADPTSPGKPTARQLLPSLSRIQWHYSPPTMPIRPTITPCWYR